jgi:hypothetical protein
LLWADPWTRRPMMYSPPRPTLPRYLAPTDLTRRRQPCGKEPMVHVHQSVMAPPPHCSTTAHIPITTRASPPRSDGHCRLGLRRLSNRRPPTPLRERLRSVLGGGPAGASWLVNSEQQQHPGALATGDAHHRHGGRSGPRSP